MLHLVEAARDDPRLRLAELGVPKMVEKLCFVITPIGEPSSDTRKRSDQVLKHVVTPAVEKHGYKAVRADQISEPGMITSQVLQHIMQDDLVVADLTERNPNVFYELAVRHAIRKPLIQMMAKGEQIPFDVAGTRVIFLDHRDLDSVEAAKGEMTLQIISIEKDPTKVETPISVSLDLQILKQSENPEARSLGDLLSAITELRTSVSAMQKKIDDPSELLPPGYLREITRFSRRDMLLPPPFYRDLRDVLVSLKEDPSTKSDELTKKVDKLADMCDYLERRIGREYAP